MLLLLIVRRMSINVKKNCKIVMHLVTVTQATIQDQVLKVIQATQDLEACLDCQ